MCRTGCPTPGQHRSWGECAREARLQIDTYALAHGSEEAAKNAECNLYYSARRQGIQPQTSQTRDIRHAIDESNRTGTAYDAGNNETSVF